MYIELADNGMEMVFKPFEVFLGEDVRKELVEHVFKRNEEDNETVGVVCSWH